MAMVLALGFPVQLYSMIHETMVLPNLQRIESGLHAFGDAENFYENGADESEKLSSLNTRNNY